MAKWHPSVIVMNYLAAVLIVKNEVRSIREWLAFHAAVGVEHFYIYDNESIDGTAEAIRRFPFQSMITLERIASTNEHVQYVAYRRAMQTHRPAARWMAFIDSDEFLFSTERADLRDFLVQFESRPALAVHWLCYGSNGHKLPQESVIESYTRRAPLEFDPNRHVKSIVQTAAMEGDLHNAHMFQIRGEYVRENDQPVGWKGPGMAKETAIAARIRINHYFVRSHADWEAKVERGRPDVREKRSLDNFSHYDRNEIEDRSALRFRTLMSSYL